MCVYSIPDPRNLVLEVMGNGVAVKVWRRPQWYSFVWVFCHFSNICLLRMCRAGRERDRDKDRSPSRVNQRSRSPTQPAPAVAGNSKLPGHRSRPSSPVAEVFLHSAPFSLTFLAPCPLFSLGFWRGVGGLSANVFSPLPPPWAQVPPTFTSHQHTIDGSLLDEAFGPSSSAAGGHSKCVLIPFLALLFFFDPLAPF